MKRLDRSIDVEFITRTFFPKDIHNPAEINKGRCFLFAYITYRIYKDARLYDYGVHAFIQSKSNKKFYDSERVSGEKDWRDLPATNFGLGCFCIDCQKPARPIRTATRFKSIWKKMADKYGIDWKEVNRQIEKVLCDSRIKK